MIVSNDGYGAVYYKDHNKITILLPQTGETATNTFEPIIDRKVEITEEELALFVNLARVMFRNGD